MYLEANNTQKKGETNMTKTLKDGLTLEEMKEQGHISKEVELATLLELYYENEVEILRAVKIGYENEEDRYRGHYEGELYELEAKQVKFKNIYEGPTIIKESPEDGYVIKFYGAEESANRELNRLESSGLPSIDSEIYEFEKRLEELGLDPYEITINVEREINNGGHSFSYQVFYNEVLLLDNCFSLDGLRVAECFRLITSIRKGIYCFHIEEISKEKDGFNRYYNVTFTKGQFETTHQVEINPLKFPQGQTRNTLEVILDSIDHTSLHVEYLDWVADNA